VRRIAVLALFVPGLCQAMAFDDARHLLARTGFEIAPPTVARLTPLSHEEAVRRLLENPRRSALTPPPSWADDPLPDPRQLKSLSEEERKALREKHREQSQELKSWWYREMLATDSPVTERMTLFWHNHFTSGLRKVKSPMLMYRQNVLLRRHALGNFRELLHAVARDPAMIVYLDNLTNRRGRPNENFARELLELFTLGEGHYSERDIKEAARAFTGWQVDRRTGAFAFNARQHDDGIKTFLGRDGPFDGGDILDLLLAQPRTAEYLSEKLWREFVSPTPDKAEVRRLAAVLRDNKYEIRPWLSALLVSAPFRAAENRGTLVKSPVELLVGTARQLRIPVEDTRHLVRAGALLGQDLFDPPNVKGWPGGNAWITSSSLLARQQVLQRLLRGMEMAARRADGEGANGGASPLYPAATGDDAADERRAQEFRRLLLPLTPVNDTADVGGMLAAVREYVLDPVYQLK
jgi:uncharacterized protein (DUF1800 family)